ncbi:hypothetical protein FJQ98_16690 [Lysinibacillus agricola]|uniref:Colicin D immunity protein domain-containing protein n=1 Tax=Lysinibacillus agricola TaxID=2590012 RepID=A0ABX7ALT6_9BACI|nr:MULTISPECIES: hypothetical protein [Lysinibacillus]KOS61437.1 hypothetical protein AN161_17740 [Lysinibacillus sp. FJAT-14222]QQP10883.1 hypothetical protein FJQ98_16690 [Lysinibacillus agricola]
MNISDGYVNYLKDRFYETLCLFEEKNEGLPRYIESFSYELYGLQYLVEDTVTVITLLNILEHFYDDSLAPKPDIKVIRGEVFRCISLINRMFKVGETT